MSLRESTELESATHGDPWNDFDRAFEEIQRRFFDGFGFAIPVVRAVVSSASPSESRSPPVDVTDSGRSYTIRAELPGIPKDKLEIRIRGSRVEIEAKAEENHEAKDGEFLRRERVSQSVYRAFELPEPVVADKAVAKLVDGVLELALPKQTPTPGADEVKVPVQ